MKKAKMLKKNYEFKNVLEKRNHFGGRYLDVFLMKNNENINYLGIAVSKKVANSVQRNKIKRYIREAYTNIEDNINNGFNIIIIWKRKVSVEEANFHSIKKDLIFILQKANIYLGKEEIQWKS